MSADHQLLKDLQQRLAEAEGAADRIRASEARHKLLIDSWTQAVWETDADGVVVADSPSWRAYTGQTLEEWFGYGWLDAVHPDDRAYAERQWRNAVAARRRVNADFRLRAPDGGWRWTNILAAPVLDAQGNVEKWAGLNIDIDQRKRTEAALRESEARLQTVFETIGAGFCIVEVIRGDIGRVENLKFVATNPALEKQTGLVDVVGKNVLDVIPEYDRRWLNAIDEVATSGEPQRIQDYQPAMERWYDGYFTPLSGAGSSLVAVVFNDVSAQKQAELKLRENEERQSFLLRLSDALRPLSDATAIQQVAVDLLGQHLGVGRAGYYGVEADQNAFFLTARWEREAIPLPDRMLITDFGDEIREGYLAGRTMVARDTEQDASTDDNLEAVRAIRVRAWIGVPLVKAGRWVAAVGVHSSTPRDWTPGEIRLVEEVGERTWAAIERAHAQEALRDSEALRRVALAGGGMGTWRWDLQNRLVWGDEQFLALWGFPPSDKGHTLSHRCKRSPLPLGVSTQGRREHLRNRCADRRRRIWRNLGHDQCTRPDRPTRSRGRGRLLHGRRHNGGAPRRRRDRAWTLPDGRRRARSA